ncbi:glycoside hydrolase [Treponema phagedenis]|uniref:Glycoside hydrolase n=1 Tax=Treponema phagedenis TaxID=162 RepID=A0A0B7GQ98_TREPH|nr:isoamylase early set domain-containing protein [Treponema phagedenis]NVP23779.1 isoamylase early set domain-containing protein [Treponema phagedenis]QEJ94413.1 glycoside hydrolase [Treponema phagedenis]QEJ97463.1 glycoside hydrolase [Treponema phagedenis]QEK01707.1 glycoside hydrolase [Treponema phagedenis]QEK03035.1 glycoside hydrolase [Treponema phagedenis]
MALHKSYSAKEDICKVKFELPAEVTEGVRKVALVGDFNNWQTSADLLKKNKKGIFSITLKLKRGEYQFRYLIDDCRWENDWAADNYVPSNCGAADNSVVIV